jgi:hypothetical protein
VSAPCFVFRRVAGRVVSERVHDARTFDKRLAQGWVTSRDGKPTQAPEPVAAPEPASDDVAPTRAELEAHAADIGLKVDGRWSDKRLMAELAKALEAG